MKKVLMALLVSSIVGCASQPTSVGVQLDPYYTKECQSKLPLLAGSTDEEILKHEKAIIETYAECKRMNNDKAKVIKSLSKD